MRVELLQYDVSHDIQKNYEYIKSKLKGKEGGLCVLPELSLCGYLFKSREELFSYAEEVPSGTMVHKMIELSKENACTVIFGIAERENEKVFNTAVVVSKGRYIGKYRKIHLSDFEKKLFDRGNENLIFEVDGLKIGVQICFDLWFPEVSREQRRMGADIFCVLANFGGETSYHIAKIRAVENLMPLVLCNRIGAESISEMDADFLGKSTVIDAFGKSIYVSPEKIEDHAVCEVEAGKIKSNIICSNFDSEIDFHYQGNK